MSIISRNSLKASFVSGTAATQTKFDDLFDSMFNKNDDSLLEGPVGMTGIKGLWLDETSGAPTGATSIGSTGQVVLDGPDVYICNATDSWIKITGATSF